MNHSTPNKLATKPMVPLIVGMAVPAMLSMLVSALYNVVDSIYVAKYAENALTAVSLVFPLQQLVIAVGVGTAVGVNSLISRSLGAKNLDEASRAARHGLVLAMVSGLVFVFIGLCSRYILQFFTNTPEILEQAVTYSHIVVGGSIGLLYTIMCEKIVQATGNMILPMIEVLAGAIVNIALDPILIFGYFGLPAMGVKGAAIATVTGQLVSAFIGIYVVHFHQKTLNTNLRNFRYSAETVGRIYQVGLPSIVMQSVASVMTSGLNLILIQFSETAVAVLGVYFKLQSFVCMPVFGINQGALPVIGFSYGAGNCKRMWSAFWVANAIAMGLMVTGFLAFLIFPVQMMTWFTDPTMWANGTPELVSIGAPALRAMGYSYLGAGFSIICMTLFQGTGHGISSLVVSVCRQLGALLPIAWAMSKVFGLMGVWYAFGLAEIVSVALSVFMLVRLQKKDYQYMVPVGE